MSVADICSLAVGELVPIPTLPLESIRIRSAKEPALFVKNVKLPLTLVDEAAVKEEAIRALLFSVADVPDVKKDKLPVLSPLVVPVYPTCSCAPPVFALITWIEEIFCPTKEP
jgi:hypothetical protein